MNKEEIVHEITKMFTRPISLIGLIGFLSFLSFPVFWIWLDFYVSIKTSLTGLFVVIISKILLYLVKEAGKEIVDEAIKDKKPIRFKDKVEKLMNENNLHNSK